MKLEPRVVRLITTITEYQCDSCKECQMVRDKGCSAIQLTDPPRFKHACTQCGSVDWLSGEYPLFKNSYTSVGNTSASEAERIKILEQEVEMLRLQRRLVKS